MWRKCEVVAENQHSEAENQYVPPVSDNSPASTRQFAWKQRKQYDEISCDAENLLNCMTVLSRRFLMGAYSRTVTYKCRGKDHAAAGFQHTRHVWAENQWTADVINPVLLQSGLYSIAAFSSGTFTAAKATLEQLWTSASTSGRSVQQKQHSRFTWWTTWWLWDSSECWKLLNNKTLSHDDDWKQATHIQPLLDFCTSHLRESKQLTSKSKFLGVKNIPEPTPTSTPVTLSWRSRSERRRAVVHSLFSAVSAHLSRYVVPFQLFPVTSALQPAFRRHPSN